MADQNERRRALRKVLRAARQEAGLTQVDVAQRLSQPQSFVSKYEAGGRRLDLVELLSVCAALNVEIEELIAMFRKELSAK